MKYIVLQLDEKDENGNIPVSLWSGYDGRVQVHPEKTKATLPYPQSVIESYERWKEQYVPPTLNRIRGITRGTEVLKAGDDRLNAEAAAESFDRFKKDFNKWLKDPQSEYVNLVSKLEDELQKSQRDPTILIIETPDEQLQKLFWNQWELLERYDNAGIVYSIPHTKIVPQQRLMPRDKIKILIILGNTQGLNTDHDRQVWQSLERELNDKVELRFLDSREKEEFNCLEKEQWDIIYFGGHGPNDSKVESNYIYINQIEKVRIDIFCTLFKTPINNGLKLAIFNCCNGIQLARKLTSDGIPQVITMREPVLDKFARDFISYLIERFSEETFLHSALRKIQNKLQFKYSDNPGSSDVPAIFQNSVKLPLMWGEFIFPKPPAPAKTNFRALVLPAVSGLPGSLLGSALMFLLLAKLFPAPLPTQLSITSADDRVEEIGDKVEEMTVSISRRSPNAPVFSRTGIIIAKKAKKSDKNTIIYYVLTTKDILDTRKNTEYKIQTYDNPDELYLASPPNLSKNTDLVTFTFEAHTDKYKVAKLSPKKLELNELLAGEKIHLAGRLSLPSEKSQFHFNSSQITSVYQLSREGGYFFQFMPMPRNQEELRGGLILDRNGCLIGVIGQSHVEASSDLSSEPSIPAIDDYGEGIPIKSVLDEAGDLAIDGKLEKSCSVRE